MNSRTCSPVLTVFVAAGLMAPSLVRAQPRQIDTRHSQMTIKVSKAGAFAAFGHDHQISAPIESGTVDAQAKRVELKVRTGALRVLDPKTSDSDRAQIQKTMLGPEVLDAERYAEITFRATTAESAGPNAWHVSGELTLHGQTRPVTVEVREDGGRYVGSAALRQTEFGIKPVKVAGGTVKVKDELQIEFQIQLEH